MNSAKFYMPQLDGLRAIAVISVIFHHLFFTSLHWSGIFGGFGVRLFFVLSGFLITGILLDTREKIDRGANAIGGATSIGRALYIFWARRALRIFPLYFGTVLVLLIFSIGDIHEIWPWLMTFSSNFYMAFTGKYAIPVSHFWSLAVEEQFYFVWPLLILLLPRKMLAPTMIIVILLGPSFRILTACLGWPDEVRWYATPASLDSLAMGALLSWYRRHPESLERITRGARLLIPISILCFLLAQFIRFQKPTWLIERFAETAESFTFVLFVAVAASGFKKHFGKFLEWWPMQRIGRLSYGLYVYHVLVWYFVHFTIFGRDGFGPNINLERILILFLTFLIAEISWRYYEQPLLRFKFFFPYEQKSLAQAVQNSKSSAQLRRL